MSKTPSRPPKSWQLPPQQSGKLSEQHELQKLPSGQQHDERLRLSSESSVKLSGAQNVSELPLNAKQRGRPPAKQLQQSPEGLSAAEDLLEFHRQHGRFTTLLADPPWQFMNRTGKMAPEHKRLHRYPTLTQQDILELPVAQLAADKAHLYLWCPNALIAEGLEVMKRWGFEYKTNLIWYKTRKDGGPDGRGVGFYFRNVTEMILFGVRGKNNRTLKPGRTQTNIIVKQRREHSRKPDEQYELIERCSPGPYLELFARNAQPGWKAWGNQIDPEGGQVIPLPGRNAA